MKMTTNVTLDEEIIKKIDEMRDLVPRSAMINRLLKERLGIEELK